MQIDRAYRRKLTARLARMATRQHGVVAMWQLLEIGHSRDTVQRMLAAGELLPIHRGTYAVGHKRLTIKSHCMAAVLACGPQAVLSHHAAAALWDLRPSPQGRIDVTVTVRRSHEGVRCHVSRSLPPRERTIIDGIPVTTLSRTLLDYAEIALPRQLRAALEAAERQNLLDARRIEETIASHHGRRAIKPLREALAQLTGEAPWLQPGPEEVLYDLLRDAGLPLPRTNVLVEGELVDCVWPEQRLIVEVDSWGFHRSRRSFEADRARDIKLQTASARWRVIRPTEERIRTDAPALLAQIRQLLDSE